MEQHTTETRRIGVREGRRAALRRLAALPLLAALAACGATPVSMSYAPSTGTVATGPAVVTVGAVTDGRGEDPHWLGTIRGGFGNPLKTVTTQTTVSDTVAQTLRQALAARGMLAPEGAGRLVLTAQVARLDGDRMARQEAHADILLTLTDRATGREVWRDQARAENTTGSVLALDTGIFASPDELGGLVRRTLGEAVDRALDSPGFQAALRRG